MADNDPFLCKLGPKKQSVVLHTTFLHLFLLQSINVVFLFLNLSARPFGIPMLILAFIFICVLYISQSLHNSVYLSIHKLIGKTNITNVFFQTSSGELFVAPGF